MILQTIWERMRRMFLGETALTQTEKEAAGGMLGAAQGWMELFRGRAPWLLDGTVHTLNLPCAIAGELARLTTVELTGTVSAPAGEPGGVQALGEAGETSAAREPCTAGEPGTAQAENAKNTAEKLRSATGGASVAGKNGGVRGAGFAEKNAGASKADMAGESNSRFGAGFAGENAVHRPYAARAAFLQSQLQPVLRALRTQCEYALAGGSLVMKPYVEKGRIGVDFVRADGYIPTQWNSRGEVTGAVFIEQLAQKDGWYTRLERHTLQADCITVENRAYFAASRGVLGTPVALEAVEQWAQLAPQWEVRMSDGSAPQHPLFVVFRMPFANQEDPASPAGVSAYSRAVGLLEQADRQYSRILWEYEGSELAVDASVGAVQVEDGKARLPRTAQRLFRELGVDRGDGGDLYSVYSPDIRDSSLFNGLEQLLRRIEFACYLSYGTLSSAQEVEKTAEEIKMSRQRSYSAVCDIQKALADSLRQLVGVMDLYATLYHLAPEGAWEAAFSFGDAVTTDTAADRAAMREDCLCGAAAWWEYRVRFYGESEAQARHRAAQAARMAQEGSVDAKNVK